MANIKPTVKGQIFTVSEGDGRMFLISEHHLPDHFYVEELTYDAVGPFGYLKTTVWEQIDRKLWIIR